MGMAFDLHLVQKCAINLVSYYYYYLLACLDAQTLINLPPVFFFCSTIGERNVRSFFFLLKNKIKHLFYFIPYSFFFPNNPVTKHRVTISLKGQCKIPAKEGTKLKCYQRIMKIKKGVVSRKDLTFI